LVGVVDVDLTDTILQTRHVRSSIKPHIALPNGIPSDHVTAFIFDFYTHIHPGFITVSKMACPIITEDLFHRKIVWGHGREVNTFTERGIGAGHVGGNKPVF
jgi:hypothetical protein